MVRGAEALMVTYGNEGNKLPTSGFRGAAEIPPQPRHWESPFLDKI